MVDRINRNRCQSCRLQKCLSLGMSRDGKSDTLTRAILNCVFRTARSRFVYNVKTHTRVFNGANTFRIKKRKFCGVNAARKRSLLRKCSLKTQFYKRIPLQVF